MNPLRAALAAVFCLLLTACIPTSDNPLSAPESAQADDRLVGNWKNLEDQDVYHITRKEGPWMHVDIINKSGEKTDSYDFFTTTLGKNTFANVLTPKVKDSPRQAYMFIRCAFPENGALKISSMSPELCADAVKSGKLKGVVTNEKESDVHFTASSEELAQFLKEADVDHLFNNEATLLRIKDGSK